MVHAPGILVLPDTIQSRLDEMAERFLAPDSAPAIDFSRPEGEEALVPATSVSWRIFKNPVSLFIGGVTAVILELAEPRVRDGVWQNTSFRDDPLPRLQRTGLAAMVTVYGPKSQAEAMIAGVRRMHDRVEGTTSEGETYRANDPVLLDWVQATATFGFLCAYHTWVRELGEADQDRVFEEAVPAAALYGATGAPRSHAELSRLFRSMRPRLAASPILFEFLELMRHVEAMPGPLAPLQRLLIKAAVELVPGQIREIVGLGPEWSLRAWERPLVRSAARLADRVPLRRAPPALACRRLGYDETWLYRRT